MIVPVFIIWVILVLLEASALLKPNAICSLFPNAPFPIIIPLFIIVPIIGAILFPPWVPCKSIPIFWLLFKLIVALEVNTKPFPASSITKALLLLALTLNIFPVGIFMFPLELLTVI